MPQTPDFVLPAKGRISFSTPLSHATRCVFIPRPPGSGGFRHLRKLVISSGAAGSGFRPALQGQDFVFLPFSHAAWRVFTFHTQTHVCVFTRAHRRVFTRFSSPRGKAACAILNPRQRVAASSPGWSRACDVTRGWKQCITEPRSPQRRGGRDGGFTCGAFPLFPIVTRQSSASAELRSSVDGSRDGAQALPIYGPVNGWLL